MEKQMPEENAGQRKAELAETEDSVEKEVEEFLEEEKMEESLGAGETALAAEEEEAARPEKRKKEKEEEIVEERVYTIPLAKAWIRPPKKRAPRAMHMIREFIIKHLKLEVRVEEEEKGEMPTLTVSKEVNEWVWSRGIEKPPRKVRVRTAKDKDGNVTVYLADGE